MSGEPNNLYGALCCDSRSKVQMETKFPFLLNGSGIRHQAGHSESAYESSPMSQSSSLPTSDRAEISGVHNASSLERRVLQLEALVSSYEDRFKELQNSTIEKIEPPKDAEQSQNMQSCDFPQLVPAVLHPTIEIPSADLNYFKFEPLPRVDENEEAVLSKDIDLDEKVGFQYGTSKSREVQLKKLEIPAIDGHNDLKDDFEQRMAANELVYDRPETANNKRGRTCCMKLWGGPIMPAEDQDLWAWVENFFGGVTTAHGINQAFKEYNGIFRRCFWMCAFIGSFYLLYFFISDAIRVFIDAETATAISMDTHGGLLPMVTLCNLNPIRCGCQAFYDPSILADDNLVKLVLPYVCSSVVGFQLNSWERLDPNGNVLSWNIAEDAINFVNFTETKSRMKSYPSQISCDNGVYTAAAIVAKIKSGTLTFLDLYSYSGYSARTELVRNCMALDTNQSSPSPGQKVSCMDDSWWGPPAFDSGYGACQTFNPCHGFPVGSQCSLDSDCQHYANPTLSGGACQAGVCSCSRCNGGQNCKLATQMSPGRGLGIRIVADVATDQDPTFAAASNARWIDGMLVHLHTQHDNYNLDEGFGVSPGTATDIQVQQDSFSDSHYPFTNCSKWFNVDVSVCRSNCLRRMQAVNCCGLSVPKILKGQQPGLSSSHSLSPANVTNAVLLCNILDSTLSKCFADQSQLVSEGMACIEGTQGFSSPYYGGLWARSNWYDDQDVSNALMIGSQEQTSLNMLKQCVWSDEDGNSQQALYGKSCNKDSDCAASNGGKSGLCSVAHRAYCPPKCDYYRYRVGSMNSASMSTTTVQLMAADELARATAQYKINPILQRRWKPLCGVTGVTTNCFTAQDAEALVSSNYAILNIDFVTFDETLTQNIEGITLASLMGTIGGNLGMFVGMSVMSILEWLELLFFAIISMPYFFCAVRGLPYVRKVDEPEVEGGDIELGGNESTLFEDTQNSARHQRSKNEFSKPGAVIGDLAINNPAGQSR